MFSWILCCILLSINLLLLCWVHSLHSGMEEIGSQFDRRLRENTNNLIYVSSRDPHIRRLAAQLCLQLDLLRRQRHRYENGDRELKEAIANISHDLRTPLTAISGYLELLEIADAAPPVTADQIVAEKQITAPNQAAATNQVAASNLAAATDQASVRRRYLAQIRSRTEAMKDLTEQLFSYSILVSAPLQQPRELILQYVLEESLANCYAQFTAVGITPRLQMPELPVCRVLDRGSLERILSNILMNAAKYSAGDLSICLHPQGQIDFSNAAPDLTPVMAERLFERFFTVETARHSIGLGLSIARNLTERMGGTITAHYREGRLTISLYFPGN